MSILTSQIDKLRELAKAFPETSPRAALLCDAADTIRELHGALLVAAGEFRGIESENAKLRELLAGVGQLLFSLDVDYCATCQRDGINHPCPVYTSSGGECLYKTDMRDLGVKL